MTIEEMNRRRKELGYSYGQIAELSGLPAATVQKVLGGITKSPRRKTVLALEKVLAPPAPDLRRTAEEYSSEVRQRKGYSEYSVQEGVAAYQLQSGKKQGEYTLEDYYALPDEERVELIDGVIYDKNAPLSTHQLIAGHLYYLLFRALAEQKADCTPFIAPVDVKLDDDNRTMVQPDVILLCDKKKFSKKCLTGAPEFLAEVLSPSTRRKDLYLKLQKYANAGVLEYWIVDPDQRRIIVYQFEKDNDITIYSFRDTIPLGISNGSVSIDFSEIDDYIRPFMETE